MNIIVEVKGRLVSSRQDFHALFFTNAPTLRAAKTLVDDQYDWSDADNALFSAREVSPEELAQFAGLDRTDAAGVIALHGSGEAACAG